MPYEAYTVIAPNGVKDMTTGQSWAKGQNIGRGSVKSKIWEIWLAEGAVKRTLPKLAELPGMNNTILSRLADKAIITTEALIATDDEILLEVNGIGVGKLKQWRELFV